MAGKRFDFGPLVDPDTAQLEEIDVSNPRLYADDIWGPYFARLRRDAPVHYCAKSPYGPYWSITKYDDIVRVDSDHETFSSDDAWGGVQLEELTKKNPRPVFIRMDPPRHGEQRRVVQPALNPNSLALMAPLVRERTVNALRELPLNEEFDWVERVSVNLTSLMLATLFDYPVEDRFKLIRWSNIAVAHVDDPKPLIHSEEERYQALMEFGAHMDFYWRQRATEPVRNGDLISLLAHGETTRDFDAAERMGVMLLLLGGGNDTTRNSMSGGAWALHKNPDQWRKLRDNPDLVKSAVPEIIRYHTPVPYQRRTATRDVEIRGQTIKKGSRVAMWYISGNRDPDAIENPDAFIVDRPRSRQHLAFGFGIHRCLGNRLAELQLAVLWEEVIRRGLEIEVTRPPEYSYNNFNHGIQSMPVRVRKVA